MRVTVLDTETTGLDLSKHEIIQIGLIQLDVKDDGDLVVLNEQEHKTKPINIRAADPAALKVNGYLAERWTDAKPFYFFIPLLDEVWNKSDMLLGQNLIFDLRFIAKEYKRYNLLTPKYPKYYDTKHMGAGLVNEGILKSSSMDKMCKHFNIKFKGRAHTALTDCQRTVTLWQQLMKYGQPQIFTYEEPYDPYAK